MTVGRSLDWADIGRTTGPCIRPGGTALTARALEVCGLAPGACIADIGCGAGGTLEELERAGSYRLVGIDSSEALLKEASIRLMPGLLVRGRAQALPLRKACFDALFCECVLSIVSERETVLYEFARVLKQGGFLIVSDVFVRDGPGRTQAGSEPRRPGTAGLFAREELVDFLTRLGFSVLLWENHEGFLKEFTARMILAGKCIPDVWGCGRTQQGKTINRTGLGYFLLVAAKRADVGSGEEKGDGAL